MARDEALLELVTADPSSAWLRMYGWSAPTLSLGYFQAVAEARSDPRWRDVPLVRRPTGGGAIWHDQELTYALAIPRTHPLARRAAELYRTMHEAIADVLRQQGVPVARRGPTPPGDVPSAHRPFLCFTDRDPQDIVCQGHKVVGSAQRRRAGAVLQHGSILLGRSPRTPEFPGVTDLKGTPLTVSAWTDRLLRRIAERLGLSPEDATATIGFHQRAGRLEHQVYRDPGWTSRR